MAWVDDAESGRCTTQRTDVQVPNGHCRVKKASARTRFSMSLTTIINNVISLRVIIVLLVLSVIAPFYVTSLQAPAFGHYHDDGIYLVTAKALAEGRGYRLLHLPEQPYQTKYPIMLSALLAGMWVADQDFPNNLIWLKMVPFVAAIAWLFVTYRLLSARRRNTAIPIILLVAATPLSVFLATSFLAESLLAVFAMCSLLWLDKTEAKPWSNREVVIAAVFAALAFNTKTIGIVAVFTGVAILLIRRRYNQCAVYAVVSVMLCAPWLLWQVANSNAASIDAYNSLSNYYKDWTIVGRTFEEQVAVVAGNLLQIGLSPVHLTGASPRTLAILLSLAFIVFMPLGVVSDLRRRGVQSDHVYCGLYLALVVSWPWPPLRFLWSILPLLLYYSCCGLTRIWRHAPASAALLAAICLAFALPVQQRAIHAAGSAALGIGPIQIRWGHVLAATAVVKQQTSPNDTIVSMLEPTVYLLTGRQGVRGFNADPIKLLYTSKNDGALGSVQEFASLVRTRGITHILEMPAGPFAESPLFSALINEYAANKGYTARTMLNAAPGFRLISLRQISSVARRE